MAKSIEKVGMKMKISNKLISDYLDFLVRSGELHDAHDLDTAIDIIATLPDGLNVNSIKELSKDEVNEIKDVISQIELTQRHSCTIKESEKALFDNASFWLKKLVQ